MPSATGTTPGGSPSRYNLTDTNIDAAHKELQQVLDSGNISLAEDARRSHSSSPWAPALSSTHLPDILVYPTSTSDVSKIVAICYERNLPITAFGGGTGLGGALSATQRGVCISFERMNKVLGLHEADMDVRVQPGANWMELNRSLEAKGLWFPPDPAPGATIGGMIAMGCSGTNAYRHGTMRDWVISLTLVLASPNSTVVQTRNRPRKSSAGYDLTHLVVGSEGTLAIVTEATLKLARIPNNSRVVIARFDSVSDAVAAAVKVISGGAVLDAIEFVDAHSMRALNVSGLSEGKWEEVPTLFMKVSGSESTVTDLIDELKSTFRRYGCNESGIIVSSSDTAEVDRLWSARKAMGKALLSMKQDESDLFVHADAAVPVSNVAKLIEENEEEAKDLGVFCSNIGHIGDGNVHTAIICHASMRETAYAYMKRVQERALRLEGTVTGEHGIGLTLRDMLAQEIGGSGVGMMRTIKNALDPKWILNPDKVLRLDP